MTKSRYLAAILLALGTGLGSVLAAPEAAVPLAELSHIHGVEYEGRSGAILLATHHGVYRFEPGDPAILISPDRSDYMGFTALSDGTVIASGHPEAGGNLGVLKSSDSGARWIKISDGADGPVDFHAIAAAGNDANVLYGLHQGGIQASSDAGETWRWTGDAPAQTFDIASSEDGETLFAATSAGIRVSTDGGKNWGAIPGDLPAPTSAVAMLNNHLYAYVLGHGFVRRAIEETSWQVLAPDIGGIILLHLAQYPRDTQRLVAVTQESVVLESRDGGSSWSPLE